MTIAGELSICLKPSGIIEIKPVAVSIYIAIELAEPSCLLHTPPMKSAKYFLILLAALFGGFLVYIGDVFWEDSNFRIMSENTIYRAAQITGEDWNEIYTEHAFASILNLRGANAGQPWYPAELTFASSKGIPHYDLALSANKQPDMATMDKLVAMMKEAPKPLLIHCKQGADRTGLASALYAYAIAGQPVELARKQLSILYGHFPWLISRTGAMDRAFDAYVIAHPI